MNLAPTDAFTDLVFHVLGHVRVAGPENLYDARYVGWAQAASVAVPALDIGASGLVAVNAAPALYGSLAQFRRDSAAAAFERLDPKVGPALYEALAAAADPYERVHGQQIATALAAGCDAVAPWLEQACRCVPGLAERRVELSWALGGHGRALARRLVVGSPAAWNELDPITAVVWAVHEHAVTSAGPGPWLEVEWAGLQAAAEWMRAAPDPLRRAHTAWLTHLDLEPLFAQVLDQGLATQREVSRLRRTRS